jgi:hypothetical protein
LESVRTKASQIRLQELRLREVPAERGGCIRINVKTEDDLHPGCLQASACSTATGEKIEDFDLHRSLMAKDQMCISLILRGIDLFLQQKAAGALRRGKYPIYSWGDVSGGRPSFLAGILHRTGNTIERRRPVQRAFLHANHGPSGAP